MPLTRDNILLFHVLHRVARKYRMLTAFSDVHVQNLEQDLREAKETATQAKLALHTETEQVQEKLTWLTAATMEAKEQVCGQHASTQCTQCLYSISI